MNIFKVGGKVPINIMNPAYRARKSLMYIEVEVFILADFLQLKLFNGLASFHCALDRYFRFIL